MILQNLIGFFYKRKVRTMLFFYGCMEHCTLGNICNGIIIRQKVAKSSTFSYLLLPEINTKNPVRYEKTRFDHLKAELVNVSS